MIIESLEKNKEYSIDEIVSAVKKKYGKACRACVRIRLEFLVFIGEIEQLPNGNYKLI